MKKTIALTQFVIVPVFLMTCSSQCYAVSCCAVSVLLHLDSIARTEAPANLQLATGGVYDPEFHDFDVQLPLDGIDADGNPTTLTTVQLSGFGNDGLVPAPVRDFNLGTGVTNRNGQAINGGDVIRVTFDRPVILNSYSVAFTIRPTNVFYQIGETVPVELAIPELETAQLIDIPDIALPPNVPFTVGSRDFQFLLWDIAFQLGEVIPEPSSQLLLALGLCSIFARHRAR